VSEAPTAKKGMPPWGKVLLGCGVVALGLGVMGVVGFVALVEAFRTARVKACEAAACHGLAICAKGQAEYRLLKNKYAASLPELAEGKGKGGEELRLIPYGLAKSGEAGGSDHGGYRFRMMKTIGGEKVDLARDFAICAIPAGRVEGVAGKRSFIVRSDGKVWSKQRPEGSDCPTDFPANPKIEGWKLVEGNPGGGE
jgi:hypothetical protein